MDLLIGQQECGIATYFRTYLFIFRQNRLYIRISFITVFVFLIIYHILRIVMSAEEQDSEERYQ